MTHAHLQEADTLQKICLLANLIIGWILKQYWLHQGFFPTSKNTKVPQVHTYLAEVAPDQRSQAI